MWFLSKFILASTFALFIFQNSTQQAASQSAAPAQGAVTSPAPGKTADTVSTNSAVAPTQAVITVHGLCGAGSQKGNDGSNSCTRIMTREQFENLAEALNVGGR